MNDTNVNIALTFSGGGYRAAAFSLGVLSYLDRLVVNDKSILQHVTVLSTVSGGTITGAMYAIGLKENKSVEQIYKALLSFMKEKDLIALAMNELIADDNWNKGKQRNLINAIANVYNLHLFRNAKFGTLLNDQTPIHLKHIIFNATEFNHALPFRFQYSQQILSPGREEPDRGIIGNFNLRVPQAIAENVRMAEILAASSCFPGGFEPLIFPNDFLLPKSQELDEIKKSGKYPVCLMDGGIVDNQGIGSVLLAEKRIKRNLIHEQDQIVEERAIDLIIVSDVASPFLNPFLTTDVSGSKWWHTLTPKAILLYNSFLLVVSLFLLIYSLLHGHTLLASFSSVMFTIALLIFFLGKHVRAIPRKFGVPAEFMQPIGKLLQLQLGTYENMIFSRASSLVKMATEIFLKHIRRLNYHQVFTDETWKNRRIMNAIYELKDLSKVHKKIQESNLPSDLYINHSISAVATVASEVGTTLWFTKEELKVHTSLGYDIPDIVIACGHFTICWNLLEYIEKIKNDSTNTSDKHKILLGLEDQLRLHWIEFKKNPFWLVDQLNR